METDKQLYRVFGAQPAWVFELAGLPPVGKCAMLDYRTSLGSAWYARSCCRTRRQASVGRGFSELARPAFAAWLTEHG